MKLMQARDSITPHMQRIRRDLGELPREAYQVWLRATPRRTGNARRRTRLQGDTIRADYDYAVPLDQGHSPQSPRGMSEPTERFIRQHLQRILRK